jgi:hypothetical protein
MEDNLIFWILKDKSIFRKKRRPHYFGKLKTTSIFWQMEDNLNILVNGRRPQYFGKWKTTSIFGVNGRQTQYFGK